MKIVDENLVDAYPADLPRYRNVVSPSLVRCDDGTLLLVFRIGSTKNSADGTLLFCRSSDEGVTWHSEPFARKPEPVATQPEYRTGALSRLADGSLLMLVTWIDHPNAELPLSHPETEGLLPVHIGWMRSSDSGRRWSSLREIDVSPLVQPCGNGAICPTGSGRWIAAFETYKAYEDPRPWSAASAIVTSDDSGRTWSRPRVLAIDSSHWRSYWDQHVRALPDGTLVNVLWSNSRDEPARSDIYVMRGSVDGETWSEPSPVHTEGQFPDVVMLRTGEAALLFVRRAGEPSIRLRLCHNGDLNFGGPDSLIIYNQKRDDLAATKVGDYAAYLRGMGSWSFGWPTAVECENGDLIVAHYCGDTHITRIRTVRIALPTNSKVQDSLPGDGLHRQTVT